MTEYTLIPGSHSADPWRTFSEYLSQCPQLCNSCYATTVSSVAVLMMWDFTKLKQTYAEAAWRGQSQQTGHRL